MDSCLAHIQPKILGLIGYPLKHSFSKKYFTEKFVRENIQHFVYENFEIESIDLVKNILKTPYLKGLNITIPYKQTIIPYAHYLQEEVKHIGACNCLLIKNENEIIAYNTDIIGIRHSLLQLGNEESLKNKKALVLGTGGASLAVQYVLNQMNIPFQLISRTASFNTLPYERIDKSIMDEYLLIINTSPVGTFPNISEAPLLPYSYLRKEHILFDLVYNPAETQFLSEGRKKNCLTINGLPMLHAQAEAAWEIWNS